MALEELEASSSQLSTQLESTTTSTLSQAQPLIIPPASYPRNDLVGKEFPICALILQDGSIFQGFQFGARTTDGVSGECVFQTGIPHILHDLLSWNERLMRLIWS